MPRVVLAASVQPIFPLQGRTFHEESAEDPPVRAIQRCFPYAVSSSQRGKGDQRSLDVATTALVSGEKKSAGEKTSVRGGG